MKKKLFKNLFYLMTRVITRSVAESDRVKLAVQTNKIKYGTIGLHLRCCTFHYRPDVGLRVFFHDRHECSPLGALNVETKRPLVWRIRLSQNHHGERAEEYYESGEDCPPYTCTYFYDEHTSSVYQCCQVYQHTNRRRGDFRKVN